MNTRGIRSFKYSDEFYDQPSQASEQQPMGSLKRSTSDTFEVLLYPEGQQWILEFKPDEVKDIAYGKADTITVYECPDDECRAAYSSPDYPCIRCEKHRFKEIDTMDINEVLRVADFFS
ncbi:hypothetical protein [Vibrio sp. MA40-2]|uniref:hypothetical protein n=1 Tax=Vibrio sp. MA40-2 TaxID=3391828 RepID=UPI0039A4AF45